MTGPGRSLLDKILKRDPEEGLIRDIEQLLNSYAKLGLEEWRQTSRILLGFGLPNYQAQDIHNASGWEALRPLIQACLERFEPRLRNIRVGFPDLEAGGSSSPARASGLEILAYWAGSPLRLDVTRDTKIGFRVSRQP